MKKNVKAVSLLLAFTIMLISCKKDSNDAVPKNSVKYEGVEYPLTTGYLEYYGKVSAKQSYNMDLTLVSSGLTIYEVEGEIDSVSGTGNILYFEIFTSDSNALESRTYIFDPEETHEAGTFDYAIVGLNLNVLTFEGDYFAIVNGSIKINKKGDEYEVTVNCRNGTGKDVTGFYKGKLKYFDYGDVDLKSSPARSPSFFKRVF